MIRASGTYVPPSGTRAVKRTGYMYNQESGSTDIHNFDVGHGVVDATCAMHGAVRYRRGESINNRNSK